MSRVRLDDAVLDDQDALAAAREAFIVSDEDHRELAAALLLEEELQDGLSGGAVEVASRFVREEDLGVVEELPIRFMSVPTVPAILVDAKETTSICSLVSCTWPMPTQR